VNLKKIVTKYFLLVKFNSFEDTLEVMKAFKNNDIIIEVSITFNELFREGIMEFCIILIN